MKKLITPFLLLLAFSITMQAQVAWNNIRVTPVPYTQHILAGADTVYFSMINRSTGMVIGALPNDSLTGLANDVSYAAADSLVWRIVKGASVGTSPRVRFINLKTGKYLYVGTKGGTTKRPYMSTRIDPFNGEKDFSLTDKGQRVNAEYYYNIVDYQGGILNNLSTTATIGIGAASSTGDAKHMFRFYSKKGPQPKAALLPTPALELSATETTLNAGGNITLNAKVIKGTSDLMGLAILYHNNTIIDTLALDANGQASFVFSGLAYGTEKFALVYGGDQNYEPNDSILTVTVGPDVNAKPTKVELTLAATSELYKDVPLSLAVKTLTNDIVSQGYVLVYVNGIAKNRVTLDVLGTGSITYPNLLVGTENIKAVFIGDKMAFLDSDTARVSIEITPTTASVKPYPVYFDLVDQPEFAAWDRERGVTTSTPRSYTHYFRTDSLAGITVTDTVSNTFKVGYYLAGATYDKIDNAYNRADFVMVPLGSGRPTWVKFKTPWLNAGSYNIYLSHRVSGDPKTNITSVTLDEKESYYPNEEFYGRWFKSWGNSNSKRRWNAKANSNNMAMNYLGSVSVDTSNSHILKITVAPENGATYNLDMLQFIPVDMDSVSINTTAAVSMAKIYYPMFDWLGFARQPGYDAAAVPATYSDFTQFAIPYQVADLTDWGTKISHTIDSVGLYIRNIGGEDYVANYVTVYRAEDKWTRVAEGYSDEITFKYTCELPKGNYYYQTIKYTDLGDGAADYRTYIKDGYFTVNTPDAVNTQKASNIKAFANGNTLTIKGIKAGARVIVTDLTGKLIVNSVASSDVFTKTLYPSVYIVKVVSDNDILRTKVLVK